jgi:hypothetical protein
MFCTPPKHLLSSQLLFLKEIIEEYNGNLTFIHKYLLKLEIFEEKIYIKINLFDNEFYLFFEDRKLMFFQSFHEMRDWIHQQLKKGKIDRE